jgi:predicted nucleotidyltransferase
MKELEEIMAKIKEDLPYFADKYKVKSLGVFGSYVRGEQKKRSDLDVLVEFTEPIGLFEYIALERELGERTGKKVDLVMKTALKPRIGKNILAEVRYL